ncbi:hypothetical protein DERF_002936 [Dermatophagoides farinae]|uniref:Uncharacterized protein n=1 Tax=Dermatophagoides farinae TaxID=6954 RepID=A0A922LB31_DERFA|nr:hypothetical protein DERF_002936 [Dermatophagoides farinae]
MIAIVIPNKARNGQSSSIIPNVYFHMKPKHPEFIVVDCLITAACMIYRKKSLMKKLTSARSTRPTKRPTEVTYARDKLNIENNR